MAGVEVKEYAHANGRFGLNIVGHVDDKDARRAGRIARRANLNPRGPKQISAWPPL